MSRMICVSEYLLDGFGSEEPADHPTSTGCYDGEKHRRVNGFLSNMGSSIAGLFHGTVGGTCGADPTSGSSRFEFSGPSNLTCHTSVHSPSRLSHRAGVAACRAGSA